MGLKTPSFCFGASYLATKRKIYSPRRITLNPVGYIFCTLQDIVLSLAVWLFLDYQHKKKKKKKEKLYVLRAHFKSLFVLHPNSSLFKFSNHYDFCCYCFTFLFFQSKFLYFFFFFSFHFSLLTGTWLLCLLFLFRWPALLRIMSSPQVQIHNLTSAGERSP